MFKKKKNIMIIIILLLSLSIVILYKPFSLSPFFYPSSVPFPLPRPSGIVDCKGTRNAAAEAFLRVFQQLLLSSLGL